ncbi:MAG: ATP-dependent helicase [Pirellulaceae bacterium]|nr:MAG: ATP-dependent helicase [Pirellulaceae bacterium]
MNRADDPDILQSVMLHDRHRLLRQWRRLSSHGAPEAIAQWHRRAEQSRRLCEQRAASVPAVHYDSQLPIVAHREQILATLQQRQVIVVCGETGSGKSTQLPKFCLEAGLAARGIIGHTQPRRLAARAVASRLAEELGTDVGSLVGYKIRFSDMTAPTTLVKVMTDGIVLAETQSDRFLEQYSCLIVDEAHERSLNIDFLLGYVKRLRSQRRDLKIIITSATIDPQRFAEHFADEAGPAPIIEVSGRNYPVEVRYRPLTDVDDEPEGLQRAIASAVEELQAEGAGDTLVFLPTERHIRQTSKYLRGMLTQRGWSQRYEILPLYARLNEADQNKIFHPGSQTRLILATNVAESSITVPRIRYVIDSGQVRINRYAPRSKVQRLPIEAVSQASANQRTGRCGRLGPGICIRLYSEEDFNQRPKYTTPEIRRSDLAAVLLHSLMLALGPLEEFPLMDQPSGEALRDAQRTLRELGAVDDGGRLTPLGRKLGGLPCDPRIGRILLEAAERRCLNDMLIIAAALECPDIRRRPEARQAEADQAHRRFADPQSDFLGLLRLWRFCNHLQKSLSRSRFRRAMEENFLSLPGYWQWRETIQQLRDLMRRAGMPGDDATMELPPLGASDHGIGTIEGSEKAGAGKHRHRRGTHRPPWPGGYEAIHRSLLAGLLRGVAMRREGGEYLAAGGLTARLWPGSGLCSTPPSWAVAAELVETGQRYLRTVAAVDRLWIEEAGSPLLKHRYTDPHWSKKTGSAMVYRSSTLFGLPVVTRRRVPLAPVDPTAARALFIEEGLVAGQLQCEEAFYRHNQEMLADVVELVHRTRQTTGIADRYDLIAFYQQRLPPEVVDMKSLRRWLHHCGASPEPNRLYFRAEDLVRSDAGLDRVDREFPNVIDLAGASYPLRYRFEPGEERDGVTMQVPSTALRQLDEQLLEWFVPGHLVEKIHFLIRALPKSVRTALVPANEKAQQLADAVRPHAYTAPFLPTLAKAMSVLTGETIHPSMFDRSKVPDYLRFRMEVIDTEGRPLASGRNLEILQHQCAPANAEIDLPDTRIVAQAAGGTITLSDFAGVPQPAIVQQAGVRSQVFPALVDCEDHVEWRWLDNPRDAEHRTFQGWVRLFSQHYRRQLRRHIDHLPTIDQAALKLAYWLPGRDVREEVQLLTARIAFLEGQAMPQSREDVERLAAESVRRISVAVQDVSRWLPKLSEHAHGVRALLESVPASWREVEEDVHQQLAALFGNDWMRTTAWTYLQEFPRYLQAIRLRFERLQSAGLEKDRRAVASVSMLLDRYREAVAQCGAARVPTELETARWMIEEYRVAQFAQRLGTRMKVSEKRILQLLT